MLRWALIAAAISGGLAVVIGAVGAHTLGNLSGDDAPSVFDTAWRYHAFHTLAVAIVALAPAAGIRRSACVVACSAWLAGLVIFSGSLYGLAITASPWLGTVTPIGGVALIAGWLALAVAAALR